MRPGDEGAPAAPLTTDTILGQIEAAVLVTDRIGNLRYATLRLVFFAINEPSAEKDSIVNGFRLVDKKSDYFSQIIL